MATQTPTNETQTTATPHALPPKPVRVVMNAIMKTLLRSPLHGAVSEMIMILTFTGRKSGKTYHIPVSYLREGNEAYCFTRAAWARNLAGGAPVQARIQGTVYRGTAHTTDDVDAVMAGARRWEALHGHAALPRIGVMVDPAQSPSDETLRREVTGRTMVLITLD